MKISPLVALLALLTPVAAAAQVIDDPEAVVVEALVVNARLPGPAWWKVSDADTTIYVLGVPPALPKGMAWDQSVLDHRLDGAFALKTPGHAVATFPLRGLVAENGVLDQLRARGFTVRTPGD